MSTGPRDEQEESEATADDGEGSGGSDQMDIEENLKRNHPEDTAESTAPPKIRRLMGEESSPSPSTSPAPQASPQTIPPQVAQRLQNPPPNQDLDFIMGNVDFAEESESADEMLVRRTDLINTDEFSIKMFLQKHPDPFTHFSDTRLPTTEEYQRWD